MIGIYSSRVISVEGCGVPVCHVGTGINGVIAWQWVSGRWLTNADVNMVPSGIQANSVHLNSNSAVFGTVGRED